MVLLLYLQCADALLYKKHRRDARKWALFAYTSYILALATVSLGLALKWSEMIFIDDREFPGGPSAFYTASYSSWIPVTSNSCLVVLNLSANALLLYRYFVIWQRKWWSLLGPGVMFITTIPVSILFEILTVHTDSGTLPLGFAYWSLTILFNIGLTALICVRLWVVQWKGLPILGTQPNNLYEKVTDVLLESGAAYSICGILQLIAYEADYNGLRRLFQGPISQVQAVTTLLIVLRMGRGQSYAHESTSYRSPSADPQLEQRISPQAQRPMVDVSGLVVEGAGEKGDPSSATSETPLRPGRWHHIV